jgi:anti-sigma factor RsiW
MEPEHQRLTPVERANLVAYLDGELAQAEARAIATKLTQSSTARREIEVLEKTWELLDYLPRPKASEQLTARTLSEIRLRSEPGAGRLAPLGHVILQMIVYPLVALSALGLGYAITQWIWPNPTARLARDLPLAEHLDEFLDVGSFEFLDGLVDSPEFNTDRD